MAEETTEIGNGWVRDAEGRLRRADRPDGAGQCKTPTDGVREPPVGEGLRKTLAGGRSRRDNTLTGGRHAGGLGGAGWRKALAETGRKGDRWVFD